MRQEVYQQQQVMADRVGAGVPGAAVGDGHGTGAVLPHLLLHAARVLHPQERAVLP